MNDDTEIDTSVRLVFEIMTYREPEKTAKTLIRLRDTLGVRIEAFYDTENRFEVGIWDDEDDIAGRIRMMPYR